MTRRPRNRRRASSSAAGYILEVSAASPSARRRRRRQIGAWAFRLVFVAALGYGAYHGAFALFDRLFYSNPEYTLRKIEMELDGIMTREEALEATGLREGVNLFSVELPAVEKALRAEPMVKEVRIARELPDRLQIFLRARRPVMWVTASDPSDTPEGRIPEGSLLVDDTGLLMKPRRPDGEQPGLPLLTGLPDNALVAGVRPRNDNLTAALELLAHLERRPDSLLRPLRIDGSRSYRLAVLSDAGAVIIFGFDDIPGQLDRLEKLMAYSAESGRLIESVNLMVRRNTPVRFVMASAPEPVASPAPKRQRN